MLRRVRFSSGHRYWLPSLNEEENRAKFGKWASPYNHGHNYVLDVVVSGPVDPETGMIVNIKRIDDVIQDKIISKFDQKSLNDEVPEFLDHSPSLENFIHVIRNRLTELPSPATLTEIRLEEFPEFWLELILNSNGTEMMTLTRVYEFAASHRLNAPDLSPETNRELYGKCNNPTYHGHNYVLEVTVTGVPDPVTGMLVSIEDLDRLVNELVVDRYDHANLSLDIPELQGKVATSEVISETIWHELDGKLPAQLYRIRLHETARNIFEVVRK